MSAAPAVGVSERAQFHALRRAFARRFMEHEILAAAGDVLQPLADFLGILIAFGIAIAYMLIRTHVLGPPMSIAERELAAWSDELLMLTIAVSVAAAFIILFWDTLFPDLTDARILPALPVRMRTVFAAKLAAVLPIYGVLALAVNAFPLFVFPVILSCYTQRGFCEWFAPQAAATAAATVFVFCASVMLQGILINVLPYRLFRRVSVYVQGLLLAGVMVLLFSALGFSPLPGSPVPQNAVWLPSWWFVGLYHGFLGTASPEAWRLAGIGVGATVLAAGGGALGYGLGYARFVRRTVEGAGAVRERERRRTGTLNHLTRFLARDPRERAVLNFVARTLARSGTHRLVLGAFLSLGFICVLITLGPLVRDRGWQALASPNAPVAGILIVLPFFGLLGTRISFSVPAELGANWLFRFTEGRGPAGVLAAVRKFMLLATVAPAAIAALAIYPALWGFAPGLRLTALIVLIELVVLEAMVWTFRKVPFTCSYLPGKANLKVTIGFYIGGFLGLAFVASREALWCAWHPARFVIVAAVLMLALAAMTLARRRDREWGGFVYEETPEWQPIRMEL
ncbi:MAG TPA: hypothetical protein VN428_04715 [Bryobacteraceae bacterium]|nr:hypothetical protein [Bryobacteraceae bacterium]